MIEYGQDYTCLHGEPWRECCDPGQPVPHRKDEPVGTRGVDRYGQPYVIIERPTVDEEPAVDTWKPIDLGPYLRGEVERPEPIRGLARSDGIRLLYPGKEHSIIGEMESGKSWFLLASAFAEMMAGRQVVYVHFEESDPSGSVERLVALGATEEWILKLFAFVGPEQRGNAVRIAALLDPVPSLVILDGVNEAMSLHGWAIREEDGAAKFREHLVKPFTRAGAAVIVADHVVKDVERRGRGPLGSIHKANAVNGTLILLENAEPFGREQRGASHVFVTKDRPGFLRRHGRQTKVPGKTYMGTLVVDDRRLRDPWLELSFIAPAEKPAAATPDGVGADPNQEVDDRVFAVVGELVADGHKPTVRKIRAAAGMANTKVADALTRLVLAGRLTEMKTDTSNQYSITETGSQDPDDSSS